MPGLFDNNNNILIIIIIQNFFSASNILMMKSFFNICKSCLFLHTNDYWKPIWQLEASIALSLSISPQKMTRTKLLFSRRSCSNSISFLVSRGKFQEKKSHVTFLFSSIIIPLQLAQQLAPVLNHAAKYLVAFYKKNCILYNLYSHFYYQKITVHAGYSLLDKMWS